jgi:hypothetical protein
LELKSKLDALNSAKLLPKEYGKVIGDFASLIDKVEREQAGSIDKEKENLLKTMHDLEILSVQEGALHESEAINSENKKRNADKQAPVTYAEALRSYQDAKNQIATSYQDKKLVDRLGTEALFAARHAEQVNARVTLLQGQLKALAGGGVSLNGALGGMTGGQLGVQMDSKLGGTDKISVEKIILQEEDRLLGVSSALGLKDLRDLALEKQVEAMKRTANELVHQPRNDTSAALIQDLEAKLNLATDAAKQAQAKLAEKEQQLNAKDQPIDSKYCMDKLVEQHQLTEEDKQVEVLTAQLAGKDAQIKSLADKISQLEAAARPAEKSAPNKPKAKKINNNKAKK